jgi:hypothetical protein
MKIRYAIATTFLLALITTSTLAGPPLLCHVFDIGSAKSLPWIGHNWNLTGSESYDTNNLATDTLTILDSDPTVLVHMETLRRAALYGQKNPTALKQLLVKLKMRADNSANSISSFDVGYLAAILNQIHWIYKDSSNPAQSLDAYALIKRALAVYPNDPQLQFAAALVTLNGPAAEHQQYAQNALAGAKSDALLARNLSNHFRESNSETMAEMISRNPETKVARQ